MAPGDEKLPHSKLDGDKERVDEADEVLGRADALLFRHRGARPPSTAQESGAAEADFPVLTEVVGQSETTPGTAGAAQPADTVQDLMLDQIERDLRLSLLDQMRPELERLIEMRVNERLDKSLGDIMERTKNEFATELRRAVREALAQVVDDEVKRLTP